jgi:hypothetical protein
LPTFSGAENDGILRKSLIEKLAKAILFLADIYKGEITIRRL